MRTKSKIKGYIKALNKGNIAKVEFKDANDKKVFSSTASDTVRLLKEALLDFYEAALKTSIDDSGADVTPRGKLVRSDCFTSHAWYKHNCYDDEYDQIMSLPVLAVDDIPDLDDPSKHQWYVVCRKGNNTKYGRLMYDPQTNTLRSQTMAEFYENSTVD